MRRRIFPWPGRRCIFLLALLLLAGCSPKRGYEAALVLADIAAAGKPSRLKDVTPEPKRECVSFIGGGHRLRGDLYLSPEGTLAALLLIPGAAEEGKDDPRLVGFANSLARARFAVLVPDLPSLRSLQVNTGNVREVADAFDWLVSRPQLSPGGRAGVAAFSYAAGPAILAAMEPEIGRRVDFILAVGGYYDLESVLTFFTTGYFRQEQRWRHREPNAYGKWVFVLANAGLLADAGDRQLLRSMARRRMADLEAPLDDLAAGLGPEGRRVYAFVSNTDPGRARSLLADLPESIRAEIESLDLANKDLSRLKARLLLVHGRDDPIIPFTESVALARAVGRKQARLFLVDGLAHVDLEPGWIGRWRLWRAVYALLAERDRRE